METKTGENDSNECNKVGTPFLENKTNTPANANQNNEKFPIKNLCSIQFNNYEMEIFRIDEQEKRGFFLDRIYYLNNYLFSYYVTFNYFNKWKILFITY